MAEVDPLTNYISVVEEGTQSQGGYGYNGGDLSSKALITMNANASVNADSYLVKLERKAVTETAGKHEQMLSPLVQEPDLMESALHSSQVTGLYPNDSSPITGTLTASTSSTSTGLSTHSASDDNEFIATSRAQSSASQYLRNEPPTSRDIPLPPYNASYVFTSVSVRKDDQASNNVLTKEGPNSPAPRCLISVLPPRADVSSPPCNTSEVVISEDDKASSIASNKGPTPSITEHMLSSVSNFTFPTTKASATVNLNSCRKCNSVLVCSCPGPSGIDCDGSLCFFTAPVHGDVSGEDAFQSVKMKVDDKQALCLFDGKKPKEEDMQPTMCKSVPLGRLDALFDELVEYNKIAKAEQPEVIVTKLFPYQQQALNWMMIRENNDDLAPFWKQVNSNTWLNKGTGDSTNRKPVSPKGGILADDMGLGKTLVVISLIVANHLNGQPMFSRRSTKRKQGGTGESKSFQGNDEPVEKMLQRKSSNNENIYGDNNIAKHTKALKTVTIKKKREVVNRRKRLPNSKALKEPGFKFRQMYLSQITSMSTKKEKQVVKEARQSSVRSPVIIDDDKNDDGDNEVSNNVLVGPWLTTSCTRDHNSTKAPIKYQPAATLIVCPLSVLSNWTDQICCHVHPDVSLQVYMYYGTERLRDVEFLNQQDIVLTTYPTLTNDYSKGDSPLHKIKWLRVILDEGHTIRNAQTRLTKCMMDLTAQRRWVLTGTPIQNRLDDLWSVVTFLRLEPFDVKAWWNSALASSVRRGDEHGVNRLQQLLKHISIRRLKTDQHEGRPLVILPPRKVVIQEIELSKEERELYDAMQKHGQFIISRYLQNGTVLQKYLHCFAILMRLRQLCLHPELCPEECENLKHTRNVLQGLDDSDDDELDLDLATQRLVKDLLASLSSGVDEECSVCLDSLVDPTITRCAHVFCQQCIMDVVSSEGLAPLCPLCRAPVNQNELIKVPEKKKPKKPTTTTVECNETCQKSSKLDALIASLCIIRDKDPSVKSLVVSQFTSFLDLIEAALEKESFPFVRLDGRMMQEARVQAMKNFSDPSSSSPKVFLLSLSAGGVGLNLTAATRVFLMDPAWNPAVEEQCFDRSHRLGQTKEVIITKYIVMDSVEERMLSLQEKKRKLMGQAFGLHRQSEEDRRRARVRDIMHLIGL